MKNCPNCGRATLRTADWACQWCGYPLLSTGFKKTPKTFRELQEERGYFQQPSVMAEPEPEAVPEPQPEPEPELAPEREQVPELEAEPSPGPAPAPEAAPISVSEIDTTAEVIEINIKDLNAIYQTDKAAAGAKLTDKTLRVTGIVDRAVANSGLDIYYVLLTSNDPRSWNVRCTFAEESSSDLRKLVRGHVVTVQGKYAGYERNILLQDCFLVR